MGVNFSLFLTLKPHFRWECLWGSCLYSCSILLLVKFPFPNQNLKCLEYENPHTVRTHVLEFFMRMFYVTMWIIWIASKVLDLTMAFTRRVRHMGLVPCLTNFSLIQMYYFTGILLFIVTLSKTWIELRKFITSLPLFIKSRHW